MAAEKRSHEEMEQEEKDQQQHEQQQQQQEQEEAVAVAEASSGSASPAAKQAADASAVATANAGMLGLPFMLPNAALMAMNSVQQGDQATGSAADEAVAVAALHQTAAALAAAATASGEAGEQKSDVSAQQQQQLVQQQLQLLQMQQQHLQQMSPGDLSAVATMAHQMALGMVMMPMMPLMMMNGNATAQSGQASPQEGDASPERGSSEMGADSLGMGTDASGMPLMAAAAYGMGNDDTPKRKRGRPPKKDVLARTKPDGSALKQFPLWGYGMPLPFLPGFMPPTGGAVGDQAGSMASDEAGSKDGDDDANRQGKGGAKKKTRGTGKPRGRPRTRPRPGEIIRRVKPPPIAPANFPGMQEYLVQKMAEWKATQGGGVAPAADENRVNTFGSTLLPGDHE